MAAGLLHEINNPASAVQRGASRLRTLLLPGDDRPTPLRPLVGAVPVPDDPLDRSDRETAIAAALAAAGVTARAPAAPLARLGVVAREWSLTLSRASITAGAAKVELQNFGEDAHNLRIEPTDGHGTPLDVPETEAGDRTTASGTLPAGEYKVFCTLPGHDAAGMHARLEVR